jgi:NTP pyrophosphatase (non-canonical NTP hydrolase)
MNISDYQRWLQEYDETRGWDRVAPAQTFVHLVEEIGEVARLVLYKEGYRDPHERADLQAELAGELADAATFLFKLAYQFDIDLEAALVGNQAKAERRFGVAASRAEMARYLETQAQNMKRMQGEE